MSIMGLLLVGEIGVAMVVVLAVLLSLPLTIFSLVCTLYRFFSHASCIISVSSKCRTCASTFNSHSALSCSYVEWISAFRRCANLRFTALTCLTQYPVNPHGVSWNAAVTPPHCKWPATIMWRMCKCSTAYCKAANMLRSVGLITLATLRCTNTYPGNKPINSFDDTRLSLQPMYMYCGDWPLDMLAK